jgi:hypothetical protein
MTDAKDVSELPDALNNWMALSKFFPESGRLKPTWGEIREVLAYIATLTRERDEARSLCDETINMLHDADRERDALLGVLEQVRSSVTYAALLGLIDAALEAP